MCELSEADRLALVPHSSNAWGKAAGLAAPELKGLLRDEGDSMVNQVYDTIDIEAKREAMARVHAYVKRAAAAAAAANTQIKLLCGADDDAWQLTTIINDS